MDSTPGYVFGQTPSKIQVFIVRRIHPLSRQTRTIGAFLSKELADILYQNTPPKGKSPDYLYIVRPTLDDLECGKAYDRNTGRFLSDHEIDEVYRLLAGRR